MRKRQRKKNLHKMARSIIKEWTRRIDEQFIRESNMITHSFYSKDERKTTGIISSTQHLTL